MRALAVVGAIVVLCGAVGCGGSSGSSGDVAGSTAGGTSDIAGAAAGGVAGPADEGAGVQLGDTAKEPGVPRMTAPLTPQRSTVIKTAQLALRVESDRFGDAIAEAQDLATDLGGLILSTRVVTAEPSVAEVVVRVPAARFNDALHGLRTLAGGKVRSEQVSGQDVGQEFVDLEARERNLRAQRAVLLRLMDRAVSISDTIRVQNELSQVQGQIEQIRGRLLYLHDQADLSTIRVTMRETDAAAPSGGPSELRQAFGRAWDLTVSVVTGVIVAAGAVIPVVLLLGVAAFVASRLWAPVRRRIEGAAPPPAG